MLLTVEKLIYGGDGLARLPADAAGRGKAVFVPFVLEQEKIEATLTQQKPGFARATADTILEPSPHRTQPLCPYFGRCGGCHYQHASYDHQLEIKKEILRETLRRTAKLELACEIVVHPSPPWNYRNRSRFQIRTKPDFAIGYFKLASHELLPVEHCPISSPLINRALAALWQIGRADQFAEGIIEIEFFANDDDTQLLVEVSCYVEARRAAIRSAAEEFTKALPEIAGVVAFRQGQTSHQSEKLIILGTPHLTYRAQSANYRVSAGSFFQTNRHVAAELVKIVTQGRSGELALDLYSGVGLFSTALAREFHHIVSVESSQTSSADLSYNLPSNGKAVQATAEQYLTGNPGRQAGALLQSSKKTDLVVPDLVIMDPPRGGLGNRVCQSLAAMRAPRLTYVSCDPATLARDLAVLLAAGYRVDEMHLVDLFPQTYHLETVVHLIQ